MAPACASPVVIPAAEVAATLSPVAALTPAPAAAAPLPTFTAPRAARVRRPTRRIFASSATPSFAAAWAATSARAAASSRPSSGRLRFLDIFPPKTPRYHGRARRLSGKRAHYAARHEPRAS